MYVHACELGPPTQGPRRLIVATLDLTGPWVTELCPLDRQHIHVAANKIRSSGPSLSSVSRSTVALLVGGTRGLYRIEQRRRSRRVCRRWTRHAAASRRPSAGGENEVVRLETKRDRASHRAAPRRNFHTDRAPASRQVPWPSRVRPRGRSSRRSGGIESRRSGFHRRSWLSLGLGLVLELLPSQGR